MQITYYYRTQKYLKSPKEKNADRIRDRPLNVTESQFIDRYLKHNEDAKRHFKNRPDPMAYLLLPGSLVVV